jgi:hypothetical protein
MPQEDKNPDDLDAETKRIMERLVRMPPDPKIKDAEKPKRKPGKPSPRPGSHKE